MKDKHGRQPRPTSGANEAATRSGNRTNRPGRFVRPMTLIDGNDPSRCTTRYFDASGTQIWHRNHGATVLSVAIKSDGSICEVGHPAPSGVTVRCRDASGAQLWTYSHGAPVWDVRPTSTGWAIAGDPGTGSATLRHLLTDGSVDWSISTAQAIHSISVDGTKLAALDYRTDYVTPRIHAVDITAGSVITSQLAGSGDGPAVHGKHWSRAISLAFGAGPNSPDQRSNTFAHNLSIWYHMDVVGRFDIMTTKWYVVVQDGFGDGPVDYSGTISQAGNALIYRGGYFIRTSAYPLIQCWLSAGTNLYVSNVTTPNTDPPDADLLGGGLHYGVCGDHEGSVYGGNSSITKYQMALPYYPYTGVHSQIPVWTKAHNGLVLGLAVNASKTLVSGGVVAPV